MMLKASEVALRYICTHFQSCTYFFNQKYSASSARLCRESCTNSSKQKRIHSVCGECAVGMSAVYSGRCGIGRCGRGCWAG